MAIIDLSHTLCTGMPVYPGTAAPSFSPAGTIEKNGFRETEINFHTHTGTHIDAPAHFLKNGRYLDDLSLDQFTGSGTAIDLSQLLDSGHRKYDSLCRSVDFVLLYTGWSNHWENPTYQDGYPVPSPEVASWLSGLNLKGVGIDTISMDASASTTFPNHSLFLNKEILIIENLCNIDQLIAQTFTFHCYPLKLKQADGSPTRAIAFTA